MNTIANEPYVWHFNPQHHESNMDKNNYFPYHKNIGHITKQYVKLKDEIEFMIKKGYLKEFIYGNQAKRKENEAQPNGSRATDKQSSFGVINTIMR